MGIEKDLPYMTLDEIEQIVKELEQENARLKSKVTKLETQLDKELMQRYKLISQQENTRLGMEKVERVLLEDGEIISDYNSPKFCLSDSSGFCVGIGNTLADLIDKVAMEDV